MSFDRRELIQLLTFAAVSGIAGLDGPVAQAADAVAPPESSTKMEKVLGVGGLLTRREIRSSCGSRPGDLLQQTSHKELSNGLGTSLMRYRSRGFLAIMKVYVETRISN
jgi:hypothetical protein